MIRYFKFFDGDWQPPPLDPIDAPDIPNSPLLENEQVIRYMNNERFDVYRTIAWANTCHSIYSSVNTKWYNIYRR